MTAIKFWTKTEDELVKKEALSVLKIVLKSSQLQDASSQKIGFAGT